MLYSRFAMFQEIKFINEEKHKFYTIIKYQNPAGEYIIIRLGGGLKNKIRNKIINSFKSEEEFNVKLEYIQKRRLKNGYKQLEGEQCNNQLATMQ